MRTRGIPKRALGFPLPAAAAVAIGALCIPWTGGAAGPPRYQHYYGDLHTHTRFSDGAAGTPEDAYRAARAAGADFLATSDHNFLLTQDEWSETLRFAAQETDALFAALPASEYWIASGFGEVVVFAQEALRNQASFHDPNLNPLPRAALIPAFYDWLASHPGTIGLWPHPGLYGDLDEFEHRSDARDEVMGLIEIHNFGSFLGAPAAWGVHDYEPHYQMALEKGWHVMPAAVSDTHYPDWITGSPVRTVLLAEELTPEALYDAMRAQRGYATLDQNLRIEFTLEDQVMGSTLAAPVERASARIRIEDPDGGPADAITRVEIVSDHGAVVASRSGSGNRFDWRIELDARSTRYFYLRVTTASGLEGGEGVTAWTAPIWTGR
jgi:hypothetical protein